jgi:hypothetical protein
MEPNSRGVWVICISVVLGAIDTLAIILRFIARRRSKMGLAADDWLIAASLIPAHCMVVIAGFCDFTSTWFNLTLVLTIPG